MPIAPRSGVTDAADRGDGAGRGEVSVLRISGYQQPASVYWTSPGAPPPCLQGMRWLAAWASSANSKEAAASPPQRVAGRIASRLRLRRRFERFSSFVQPGRNLRVERCDALGQRLRPLRQPLPSVEAAARSAWVPMRADSVRIASRCARNASPDPASAS
jgi:hypothetical protein